MSNGKWFLVASREYSYVEPVLDDGSGPTEYARDTIYVYANAKRRVRGLAVRAWRRKYARRTKPDYLVDGHPFKGMLVERVDPDNPHYWTQP
jgi:hypothetical protein